MAKKSIARWLVILVLGVLALVVWIMLYHLRPDGVLVVSFLDVGQGDAIFIEAPNGNQVLVDGGSGRQVLRALGGVMPFYDRRIDLVVGTHADADHIGGLPSVFERFSVLGVMDNGLVEDSQDYHYFDQKAKQETGPRLTARAGQKIILDKGVELEILYPEHDMQGSEANTASIVARLIYGETEFLLTGDAPSEVEDYLARKYGESMAADVLKLGHHGSNTSSSDYFLAAVQPEYAVISAGRDNRYGHPHEEVLDRLGKMNIPYVSTAEAGNIEFRSDGIAISCGNCK